MHIKFEPIADKCGEIVEQLMSSEDMPQNQELLFKIRLSVEECVENIVRYAYERGDGWLDAETHRIDDTLVITIKDAGTPFNPLEKPDPDITLSAMDREIGGLGIFLCKQMMDSVTYSYIDNCNILRMTKKLS